MNQEDYNKIIQKEYTGEIKTTGDKIHFDIHQKGAKDDSAKPRLDLVLGDFATALWGVGLVGTFGANKYTDRGWIEVENPIERYSSALLRHYLNFKSGEIDDRESGLPHLAHLAWNALAILELWMKQNEMCVDAKHEPLIESRYIDGNEVYIPTK